MAAIRTVQFETDESTGARSVLDIREFDPPARGSAVSKDKLRKLLMNDLARQIDDLVDGHVAEIHIVMSNPTS